MATFVSKYNNLKLVIKPTSNLLVNNRPVVEYGKSLHFSNGSFHTVDPEEITFLRNHTAKGRLFYEVEEEYHKKDEDKTIQNLKKGAKVAIS